MSELTLIHNVRHSLKMSTDIAPSKTKEENVEWIAEFNIVILVYLQIETFPVELDLVFHVGINWYLLQVVYMEKLLSF